MLFFDKKTSPALLQPGFCLIRQVNKFPVVSVQFASE